MTELNSTASAAVHKALDGAADQAADTLRPMLDQLMISVHEAVDLLSQAASKAADKVEHSGKYLRDSETRMVSGCRGYVRAKPLTSVGLAVASGFLLSWALRQR